MSSVKCPDCDLNVRAKKDGSPYKHLCLVPTPDPSGPLLVNPARLPEGLDPTEFGPVSDPAPTVEDDRDDAVERDDMPEKGPWFGAMYDGHCSAGECAIYEGDRIRADGQGGYECEDCGDEDMTDVPGRLELPAGDPAEPSVAALYSEPTEEAVTDALPNADWQAQASAAARRHLADVHGSMGGADPIPAAGEEPIAHRAIPATDTLTKVQGTDPVSARRVTAADQFLDPAPRGVTIATGTFSPTVTADQFMDPASTEDVKPVMGVNGQPKKVRRDHMKRYAVALPGETTYRKYKNGNPWGYTRVTTFIKEASSTIKLGEWKARNVVIGAARRRDLLLQAHGLTHENDKDRLNAIAMELEAAAGAKVGSDLGTYLHEFTEFMDAGLKTWHDAPKEFRRSLALYADALGKAGLEPITSLIERTTIIREFGWVCGTFDRIFFHRPSGQYVIGDLKTAKTMDYGKNEIEAQLWAYAHGVNQNGIYDWNTDTWLPPGAYGDSVETGPWQVPQVSEKVGVVIHMPVQGDLEGTVSLLWADLEAGAQHAELCYAVRSQPKGKMKPWGDGPAPLAPPEPVIDFTGDWEVRASVTPVPPAAWSWEDGFSRVTTSDQASALWRQAKAAGVDRMELQRLVALAQQRLRKLG